MTVNGGPASDAPSPDEIRAEVDRMVMSEVFARSPQLGAFLRFVVEAVLHNRHDRIKAYTVGIEVLRRDEKFDPQLDPIVRVEATRLRRAIERYYAGPGIDDLVLIDLPRGGYVPTFRRRSVEPATRPASAPRPARRRIGIAIAAAVAVAAVAAGIGVFTRTGPPLAGRDAPNGAMRPGNGMPLLALHRLEGPDAMPANAVAAASLFERLRDAFPRFDAINIAYEPASGSAARDTKVPVDYRFFGRVEYHDDRTTTVRLRLQDDPQGNVVWSRAFERLPVAADQSAAIDAMVLEVSQTLLQPFGVIRAYDRVRALASGAGDPRYRCVIEASESLRSIDRAQHERARACLDRLTAADPGFVTGVRYLAAVDLREFLYRAKPGDQTALDRALKSARYAVGLQPESSRGYHTLAAVLFARRDTAQSFAAAERAIVLNRYDLLGLGDYGGRLIAAGEVDRGMDMLNRAAGPHAVRPATHHFYLFLGNYLRGNLAEADYQADQITSDTFPLGLIARALTAAAAGETDRAREALGRLVALQPVWRDDTRAQLERFFPAPTVVDRLLAGLEAAELSKMR